MEHASGSPGRESLPADGIRFFEELGRSLAGPLLRGMVQWVAEKIRKAPPDVLLFFSRDGKILHELWQECRPADLSALPTRYVLASRRCLRLAGMEDLDDDALEFLTSHARNLSVEGLFQRVGLAPEVYRQAFAPSGGLRAADPCAAVPPAALKKAFSALSRPLLEQAATERQAYRKYLASLQLGDCGRIGVVDVGWHGSLQHAFRRLLVPMNAEVRLEGYYCGLFPEARRFREAANRMRGYLLNDGTPAGRTSELKRFLEVIEFFFSAEDPSLLHLRIKEAGAPEGVFTTGERDPWQAEAVRALHRGIRDAGSARPVSLESLYPKLRRLGLAPTREEAAWLGRLRASRGFGDPEFSQPFACTASTADNLLHWRRFVGRFKNALWRPGFWAQLSLPERLLLKGLSPVGSRPFRLRA